MSGVVVAFAGRTASTAASGVAAVPAVPGAAAIIPAASTPARPPPLACPRHGKSGHASLPHFPERMLSSGPGDPGSAMRARRLQACRPRECRPRSAIDVGPRNTGLYLATSGISWTDTAGTSPSEGIRSDGNSLLVLESCQHAAVTSYAFPGMQASWSMPASSQDTYYLWGDGGGVTLAGITDRLGNSTLVGLDDATGRQLWTIPGLGSGDGSDGVCAVTGSEALLSVSGQLAIVGLRSGRQLSYSAAGSQCPDILPGGIEVSYPSAGGTVVTQAMTP